MRNEPRRKDEHRRNRRKFRLEVAGFIVLSVYTFFTALMYCVNKKTADAAKSAADTAAKQLEMSERPWITARLAFTGPHSRLDPIPGLKFNKDGTATLIAFVVFKNIGHSIATDIYATAKISPTLRNNDEIIKEMNKQKKRCDSVRQNSYSPRFP